MECMLLWILHRGYCFSIMGYFDREDFVRGDYFRGLCPGYYYFGVVL